MAQPVRDRLPRTMAYKKPKFNEDRRRKHHHYQVTIIYKDGETFARTYTDRKKAVRFAEREKESPVVKDAKVVRTS